MILTFILLLLALIHFYWALGGTYGLDKALPTDSDGNRIVSPSLFLTFVVSIVLVGFTFVAYKLSLADGSPWIRGVGWVLALIFFLRAIGDFNMVGLFKKVTDTEFAKYDRWFYTPLCLFISVNFFLLLLG